MIKYFLTDLVWKTECIHLVLERTGWPFWRRPTSIETNIISTPHCTNILIYVKIIK